MTLVIATATPFHGHVSPVLTVAADLVRRGHEVVVLTGSRYAEKGCHGWSAADATTGAAESVDLPALRQLAQQARDLRREQASCGVFDDAVGQFVHAEPLSLGLICLFARRRELFPQFKSVHVSIFFCNRCGGRDQSPQPSRENGCCLVICARAAAV